MRFLNIYSHMVPSEMLPKVKLRVNTSKLLKQVSEGAK